MKAKLAITILIAGMSLQSFGMGHPHNLFAARKQMKAKRSTASQTTNPCTTTLKVATYAKATVLTTASAWNWLTKKGAN